MINKTHLFALLLALFISLMAQAQRIKKLQAWLGVAAGSRSDFGSNSFTNKVLSKKEAREAAELLMADVNNRASQALSEQWKNKAIIRGNDTLKFEYKVFGPRPDKGRSLFISMHGGGNTAPRVNDQQWQNQVKLYTPAEGVYLAPRAPTNTWDLWHQAHIDPIFDDLIKAAVLFADVNPDKVYIMGYSAGGDGVHQLAPRMADRWAAAAMMAGHPNETSPLGLRNIGFTIHMGALDSAYNRNKIAKHWSGMLDSLQKIDTAGYKHFVQLHEGRSHWMNREDTVALPWLATFTRNPIPQKVVWKQDDVQHSSFYWLAVPARSVKTGGEIVASYNGNEIDIESNYSDSLFIRLNDAMMNLDKPVIVRYRGDEIFKGTVKRQLKVVRETVEERKDPGLVFSTELMIVGGKLVLVKKQKNANEIEKA